jgi:hypothetical protein
MAKTCIEHLRGACNDLVMQLALFRRARWRQSRTKGWHARKRQEAEVCRKHDLPLTSALACSDDTRKHFAAYHDISCFTFELLNDILRIV